MKLDIGHQATEAKQIFPCPQCQKEIHLTRTNQDTVHQCSICNCKDLHQHKDFNKKIGLTLFIVGAIFAPWTYYVSLIVALIIDACLYPYFPWMIVCYKCLAEFRGWPKNDRLERFNHEIAAHYDQARLKGEEVVGEREHGNHEYT